MSGAKPWGGAHSREALARFYELAALAARNGHSVMAQLLTVGAIDFAGSEDGLRRALTISCFDAARIDREVRRVRGLAEGRLVREHGKRWAVRYPDRLGALRWLDTAEGHKQARNAAAEVPGSKVASVYVSRIRKAAPR